MKDYAGLIELIISYKMRGAGSRRFQVERNEYHLNRIQPTDVDIIIDVLKKEKISQFDFAAELYCRTLLAQIIHYKYSQYFQVVNYDGQCNMGRYQFVETIGWCPTRCRRHIRPLVIPLLILYWDPNENYTFFRSDNPSDEDARRTLKAYKQNFELYKSLFVERAFSLFEYIVKSDTPKSVKLDIVNDFVSYPLELDEELLNASTG